MSAVLHSTRSSPAKRAKLEAQISQARPQSERLFAKLPSAIVADICDWVDLKDVASAAKTCRCKLLVNVCSALFRRCSQLNATCTLAAATCGVLSSESVRRRSTLIMAGAPTHGQLQALQRIGLSMRSLQVFKCVTIVPALTSTIISSSGANLKVLELGSTRHGEPVSFHQIFNNCPLLQRLSVRCHFILTQRQAICAWPELKHLEFLELYAQAHSLTLLRAIAACTQLRKAKLLSSALTPEVLQKLCSLTMLESVVWLCDKSRGRAERQFPEPQRADLPASIVNFRLKLRGQQLQLVKRSELLPEQFREAVAAASLELLGHFWKRVRAEAKLKTAA